MGENEKKISYRSTLVRAPGQAGVVESLLALFLHTQPTHINIFAIVVVVDLEIFSSISDHLEKIKRIVCEQIYFFFIIILIILCFKLI